MAGYIGFCITALSVLMIIRIVVGKLMDPAKIVVGWTSLLTSILFSRRRSVIVARAVGPVHWQNFPGNERASSLRCFPKERFSRRCSGRRAGRDRALQGAAKTFAVVDEFPPQMGNSIGVNAGP